ncbi:MAG TPA: DinB family protein [Pyrinomonadaceae bacterium]|nr:DinB family protein [Pyrinomonadaceae bacterium]
MSLSNALAEELRQEAVATRKMLERVPEDAFDWKPHEKSTSLGRLAGHIVQLPGMVVPIMTQDELDFADVQPFTPSSASELVEKFDENIAAAIGQLQGQPDENLHQSWRLLIGGKELFRMPRVAFIRSVMLNHLIHHRGQLSVYLRLRDVPLPSVYGPTADES